ncbi:enoyl-CoA hydratase-related protein [Sulfurimonas sp.]
MWGVVILKANELFDGGNIYASANFCMRKSSKASIYRNEVKFAYFTLLEEFFQNYKTDSFIKQILKPLNAKPDYYIDWQNDTSSEIIKKVQTFDSYPGIQSEILNVKLTLYGAWYEERLRGDYPGEIVAKRDGAICIATVDAAVWISHLKTQEGFKLPATYVLKERLRGVKEERIPLVFDKSYATFYEISYDIKNGVAYLYFNFHNGAFSAHQAIRLKYAFEYIKQQVKVVVLMGGEDFFSNGIHLNILEDSKKNGEDGWSNINAMNDLIQSILFADDIITVASLEKNAGAGGVFLATACDYLLVCEDVVLNPHYKTLALSGSEYHTYTLPKRVGENEAQRLLENCLSISASYAKKIGLANILLLRKNYQKSLEDFCDNLVAEQDEYENFLWDKQDFLEIHRDGIELMKEQEIAVMYPEFWDQKSSFHTLRYEFVYKICPKYTPKRLKAIINE